MCETWDLVVNGRVWRELFSSRLGYMYVKHKAETLVLMSMNAYFRALEFLRMLPKKSGRGWFYCNCFLLRKAVKKTWNGMAVCLPSCFCLMRFAKAAVRLFKTRLHFAPPWCVLNCVRFIPWWGSKIAVLLPPASQSRFHVLLTAHRRWWSQQKVQASNKPRGTVYTLADVKNLLTKKESHYLSQHRKLIITNERWCLIAQGSSLQLEWVYSYFSTL